jgi:hypothetical protein
VFADETTDTVLVATTADAASFSGELDIDRMRGSFDVEDFAPVDGWTEARLRAEGTASAGVGAGAIRGDVSGADEDTAWDVAMDVGTWGAASE